MQLRHLRYFVKVVEAGSFSRAAATIHVAQPALSQQIAELEELLGVTLLQRHARGVRPTPAGEVLYREAVAILRQIEQLPGIVRSTGGEPEGAVELGLSSTLAALLQGSFIPFCREALPNVVVKLRVSDSESLKVSLTSHKLDLALVFEDEFSAGFGRILLFRQRLFYFDATAPAVPARSISLADLAARPLVLPGTSNLVRRLLDRRFEELGLVPNVVSEGDQLGTLLSILASGIGGTVLPSGRWDPAEDRTLPPPRLIEPPLFLTASILWLADAAPSRALDAVRRTLHDFALKHVRSSAMPGQEGIDPSKL